MQHFTFTGHPELRRRAPPLWRRPDGSRELSKGRLQHQGRVLAAERAGASWTHLTVEFSADPAGLILADSLQPERLSERVDVLGADAVDIVGFYGLMRLEFNVANFVANPKDALALNGRVANTWKATNPI